VIPSLSREPPRVHVLPAVNICYHVAMKHVQDIAGALVYTIPSSKDFFNPETQYLMEEHLGGRPASRLSTDSGRFA
jgi:aromatic ring hydroxylase